MSWAEITPNGDPVRGDIGAFEGAERSWREARAKTVTMRDDFKRIVTGEDAVGLEGQGAEAFRAIVDESQHVLNDVPEQLLVLEGIIARHADQLRELQRAADEALNRAALAKAARDDWQRKYDQSNQRVASLQSQIDSLRYATDDPSIQRRTTLEVQIGREKGTRNTASSMVHTNQSNLDIEIRKWSELREGEDQLNRDTAWALDNVALLKLRDPSAVEQFVKGIVSGVIDFGADYWRNLSGLVKAAFSGEWENALWYLRGLLDQVIEVLALVAAAVLVAVAVGLTPFTGGASLILAVGLLSLGLGAIKLLTEMKLHDIGATHPDTGETIGAGDLVIGGGLLVLDAISLGRAGAFKNAGKLLMGRPLTSGAARHALAESGLVLKDFGNVSVRMTIRSLPWEFTKNRVADAYWGNMKDGKHIFVAPVDIPEGEATFGTNPDPSRVRQQRLSAELDAIRSGDRGLSVPIDTYLVGTY